MVALSLKNIESILFNNKKLTEQFPEFKHYFDQWKLSKQHSFLKNVGMQAVIDLMNNLNDNHLKIIEDFYNMKFKVIKLNNRLVNNFEFEVDSCIDDLSDLPVIANICLHRNKEKIFITTWN